MECESSEKPDVDSLIKNADDKMYAEKKHLKEKLKIQVVRG